MRSRRAHAKAQTAEAAREEPAVVASERLAEASATAAAATMMAKKGKGSKRKGRGDGEGGEGEVMVRGKGVHVGTGKRARTYAHLLYLATPPRAQNLARRSLSMPI